MTAPNQQAPDLRAETARLVNRHMARFLGKCEAEGWGPLDMDAVAAAFRYLRDDLDAIHAPGWRPWVGGKDAAGKRAP
jgi:hypothetical protein